MERLSLIRDLIPFRREEYALPMSRADFMRHLEKVIQPGSLMFTNYWKHKNEFVGKFAHDRFRTVRCVREYYLPIIVGRVSDTPEGCQVSVRYSALQCVLVLPVAAFIIFQIARRYGAEILLLLIPVVLGSHLIGCLRYRREKQIFAGAAGLSSVRHDV